MKQIWFNAREIAERLGMDVKSVRKLASFEPRPAKDRIPARRMGRLVKFDIREVEAWEKGRSGARRKLRMGGMER